MLKVTLILWHHKYVLYMQGRGLRKTTTLVVKSDIYNIRALLFKLPLSAVTQSCHVTSPLMTRSTQCS